MSTRKEDGAPERKIIVVDDQIGRDGSAHRGWFLGKAGRPADHFVFMTGQDETGRNHAALVVQRVADMWRAGRIALVLLDIRFDDATDAQGDRFGFRLLEALRDQHADMPIVMLTTETETRAEANLGQADGFLPKEEMAPEALERRLFANGLVPDPSGVLLGTSTPFLATLREIRRAVNGSMELLLLGETGTGKTQIARYAHAVSPRCAGPFVPWSATRGNADLQYDQLFGHWRGAFTGADQHRAGSAELAHEGTLFIDEIAELSSDGQVALLAYRERGPDGLRRVRRAGHHPRGVPARQLDLDKRRYSPDEDRVLVDTFLVTATNRPVQDEAWREKHGFRQDVYNRLGHPIEVPPLRARPDDIEPLFRRFLDREVDVAADARSRLTSHSWRDGNLAELRRVADGVRMRLGPDFREVHGHHLDGLLAEPAADPVAGPPPANPTPGPPPANPVPAPPAKGRDAPAETWVDLELDKALQLTEKLRSAVLATRGPRGTGTVPDILHSAMGTRYSPIDAKREIKDALSVWFKPNARQARRWEQEDAYRRHRQKVETDTVLASLYRYSKSEISWDEARQAIDQALGDGSPKPTPTSADSSRRTGRGI